MRDPEPRLVDLRVPVEQEVEIERPRPLGRDGRPVAAEAALDGEEQVEERARRQARSRGRRPRSGSGADPDSRPAPYRSAWRRRRPRLPSAARELRDRSADASPRGRRGWSRARRTPGSRARAVATLARVVGRRLLAVCAARALPRRHRDRRSPATARPTRSQPQEWWLAHIGADRCAPPGRRRADHDRRQRHRPDAPGVRGPPEHDVPERPDDVRARGVPRHDGRVDRGRARERRRHRRRLPDRGAPGLRREPDPRGISDARGDRPASTPRPALPGRDQPQLRRARRRTRSCRTRSSTRCTTAASSSRRPATSARQGSPPTYPASWPHVFTVGATDENDAVAPFSTHLAGDRHRRARASTSSAPSRCRATRAATQSSLDGTSFSAPIVSRRGGVGLDAAADADRDAARERAARRARATSGRPASTPRAAAGSSTSRRRSRRRRRRHDPGEPNDDIDQVKPGALFAARRAAADHAGEALDPHRRRRSTRPRTRATSTGSGCRRTRSSASTVSAGGRAAARIWGPQTVAVGEGIAARRRDLRGTSIRGGKKGFAAYVEVLLTGPQRRRELRPERHGRETLTPAVPSRPPGCTAGFVDAHDARARRAKRRSSSSATAVASASSRS